MTYLFCIKTFSSLAQSLVSPANVMRGSRGGTGKSQSYSVGPSSIVVRFVNWI